MVKLIIINTTWHTPQNRASNTIAYVKLNTINGAIHKSTISSIPMCYVERHNVNIFTQNKYFVD